MTGNIKILLSGVLAILVCSPISAYAFDVRGSMATSSLTTPVSMTEVLEVQAGGTNVYTFCAYLSGAQNGVSGSASGQFTQLYAMPARPGATAIYGFYISTSSASQIITASTSAPTSVTALQCVALGGVSSTIPYYAFATSTNTGSAVTQSIDLANPRSNDGIAIAIVAPSSSSKLKAFASSTLSLNPSYLSGSNGPNYSTLQLIDVTNSTTTKTWYQSPAGTWGIHAWYINSDTMVETPSTSTSLTYESQVLASSTLMGITQNTVFYGFIIFVISALAALWIFKILTW